MFDSIFGNETVKSYLKNAVQANRLPQTLLFSGIDGIGKHLFASALARYILGAKKSSDLHHLAPTGKSGLYAIDTLREMIDKDHAAPFEGNQKIFILDDAHRMQPAAANALLKTLEEPSFDSTFILITSQMKEILPTILSRCSVIKFQPLRTSEIETYLHQKGLPVQYALFANGSIGKAQALAENPELEAPRKLLFEILQKKPFYPELCNKITELESLTLHEDPVCTQSNIEHIFSLFLMWHRDQHVKETKSSKELLFFPDEPEKVPVDLRKIEALVEKARLAFSRNMKLSQVLLDLLS